MCVSNDGFDIGLDALLYVDCRIVTGRVGGIHTSGSIGGEIGGAERWLSPDSANVASFDRKGLEGKRVKSSDEGFVQRAIFWLGILFVFSDGSLQSPAGNSPETGCHTASSVLALVAVDQHRMFGGIEDEFKNLVDGLVGSVDLRVLVGDDWDVVVGDAVLGDEGLVVGWKDLWDQGDDGL